MVKLTACSHEEARPELIEGSTEVKSSQLEGRACLTIPTLIHQGNVQGYIHHPVSRPENGLVLTHGAGANCSSPMLVAIANELAARGLSVLRCDLPFRQRRPKGPPFPSQAERDREGLREAVDLMKGILPGTVYLGGHSYGGRQASLLAGGEATVAGLLLLSYPLHPPGKPEQLRTAHFPSLETSTLFIHGEKDPFGSLAEMREALLLIPGRHELCPISGAGHDLDGRKRATSITVCDRFLEFFGARPSPIPA